MIVKKANGKIFGAKLSASEQKALDMEIMRQLAEYNRKNLLELDSVVLWVIHETLGFGPKRLKAFFDDFVPAIDALSDRYDMDKSEQPWLCTQKLKEIGVDIEAWYKEKYPDEE